MGGNTTNYRSVWGCVWPLSVQVLVSEIQNHQLVPSRKLTYPTKEKSRKNIDSKVPCDSWRIFQFKYFGTKEIMPSPKPRPSQRESIFPKTELGRYSKLLQILSLDNLDFDTAELGDLSDRRSLGRSVWVDLLSDVQPRCEGRPYEWFAPKKTAISDGKTTICNAS